MLMIIYLLTVILTLVLYFIKVKAVQSFFASIQQTFKKLLRTFTLESRMSSNQKFLYLFFVVSLVLGVFTRVYQFGGHPEWINQDEAMVGYEAFSLLYYGVDLNNMTNPLPSISFGSGTHSIYTYMVMPFISWFGVSAFSVRIPMLIFSLLSMILFYLTVKEVSNKNVARMAFSIYAISPWGIMFSRWGLDCNTFPIFFLGAMYFLIRYVKSKDRLCILLSAMLFSLSFYAYGVSYLAVPVFFMFSFMYMKYHNKFLWKDLVLFGVTIALFSFPAILYVMINLFELESIKWSFVSIPRIDNELRFQSVTLLGNSNILESLLYHITTLFEVLVYQKDGLMWNSFGFHGTIYAMSIPFMIIGVHFSFVRSFYRHHRFQIKNLWIFFFVTSLILGVFMVGNINRLNMLFFPMIYFVAIGIRWLTTKSKLMDYMVLMFYILFFIQFTNSYFGHYQEEIARFFHKDFNKAVLYADRLQTEKIYVETRGILHGDQTFGEIRLPSILVAFTLKEDPKYFYENQEFSMSGNFRNYERYKNFVFEEVIRFPPQDQKAAYIVRTPVAEFLDEENYNFAIFDTFSVVTLK
jgi:hypothetical protein